MPEINNKSPEKATRLLDYLNALAKINSKIIKSVEEYRKVLWIHEIPHETKHCFTQAWGQEEEKDGDVWIEVKKFQEPELPRIPEECFDWVDRENLRNTKDLPELHDSIIIEQIEKDPKTGEELKYQKTVYLEHYPEVQNAWDHYLEKHWLPWAEFYNRYISVQKVYADLFHIYQEQQKLGEEYELVLCIGLLSWKTPNGHEVKRHVIVAQAALEFEAHLGKFTVKPAVDGGQIDIELDMLDIEEQPQKAHQLIESGRQILGSNLWDRTNIDSVLNSIANSLADSGQGEYYPDALKPDTKPSTKKPSIEYAPALILRKRSMRGLEQILASIKSQIAAGVKIPDEFLDLSEISTDKTQNKESNATTKSADSLDEQIYFPLPANDEQKRIIRTLDRQKGVLVQGPPGTGKSHTINNLICHLLATGKRVLVTAKTPRALKVLHKKLPEEIKPLCINLLGQGAEERESLEKSVSGILTKLDAPEQSINKNIIETLENQLEAHRREQSETDNKIIALREAETYEHNICSGQYTGTAAQIARKLKEDADKFNWFTDSISPKTSLPLSEEEIKNLCRYLKEIDKEAENHLKLFLPEIQKDLPDSNTIRIHFLKEAEAFKKAEEGKGRLNSNECAALLDAGKEKIELLLNELSDFIAAIETVKQRPMAWIENAVYDVLTDKDGPWRELLKLSRQHSQSLQEIVAQADETQICLSQELDKKKVLHDAKALKAHFEAGGRKGFFIFKPKAIKEHGELIDKIKVDGVDCNDANTLEKLIVFLTVEQELNYLWSLWSGKVKRSQGSFPIQLAEIDELNEALENIISLYENREKVREKLLQFHGITPPRWEDTASLNSLRLNCRVAIARLDYLEINKKLNNTQNYLFSLANRKDAHPINNHLLKAFQERDFDTYCKLLEDLKDLHKEAKKVSEKNRLIEKLNESAPNLAKNLNGHQNLQLWIERLNQIEEAWAWSQGMQWLDDFLQADLDSLEQNTKRLSEEIRYDLARLASIKAWQFCFNRMGFDHERHLMAWQQSMKKLGKGTGKHAHTHRQNAQRHLNQCKDAVPAWIMPLHRVYEAVEAGAGIFDVIIVDEASQCGPEALPLLYLGKRVLVVGDDKQISPEAVGLNRNQIQQLMQNYLNDFEHFDSFDAENSFFDHGRLRFNNRISLREHFRCMPEIIRFSNDLCYSAAPLIPLRQYPPNRLEPLKHVYVPNGYREGSGSRVINRPEADIVVDTIEACCNDARYQEMSMGVIVLQGEAQAYHIEEKLLRRIGDDEMENRRLICGNPYSFQGDERDIIFLSMVAAPNETIGTLTRAADQRRFNVAASRAKDQIWLFYSATTNHLSEQCYRRKLLEHFINPASHISRSLGEEAELLREKAYNANRSIEKAPKPFDSWFEVDVALRIASQGYRIVPQYEFADKIIDIVVQGEKYQLAVECDGDFWHGAEEYTADMERQRKLERCNWHFFRIRESRYYADPEKALEPLWTMLDHMGIEPLKNNENFANNKDKNAFDKKSESKKKNGYSNSEREDFESFSNGADWQYEDDLFPNQHSPTTIQEALEIKSDLIRKTIITALEQRPNYSCIKEKLPSYILKLWGVRSRGNPLKQFAKRVDDQLTKMDRQGYVKIYKSKNVRVKLGDVTFWNK